MHLHLLNRNVPTAATADHIIIHGTDASHIIIHGTDATAESDEISLSTEYSAFQKRRSCLHHCLVSIIESANWCSEI